MIKRIELSLSPEAALDEKKIDSILQNECKIKAIDQFKVVMLKRSIDARSRFPFINLLVDVYINESPEPEPVIKDNYKFVAGKKKF